MKTQISTLPKGTFTLNLAHGISRAIGYEGQNRLTMTYRDQKYTAVGGNYAMLAELLGEWLNEIVIQADDVQQRLAEILEKDESFSGSPTIKKDESGRFYINADCGQNQVEYLLRSLGLEITNIYSSNRRNRYQTGIFIRNTGY